MVLVKDLELFYPIVTGNSVYLKDLMLHMARWELMGKRVRDNVPQDKPFLACATTEPIGIALQKSCFQGEQDCQIVTCTRGRSVETSKKPLKKETAKEL